MSDDMDDPAVIERDLHATRARLGSRLNELSRRLSPGEMVDEALHYLRNSTGADFARNLTDTVRDRPVPVVLAGIGITWLMMAGPRREAYPVGTSRSAETMRRAWEAGKSVVRSADETEADFRERVLDARAKVLGVTRQAQETAQSFADRVEEALFSARDAVSDAAGWVSDTAESLRDSAAEMGDRLNRQSRRIGTAAGDSYAQMRDAVGRGSDAVALIADNPVLLGALGVVTGALLGALLPSSEIEREYLGATADKARSAVGQAASDAADRGMRAAQDAVEAAVQATGA